jgi:hypothetical protein
MLRNRCPRVMHPSSQDIHGVAPSVGEKTMEILADIVLFVVKLPTKEGGKLTGAISEGQEMAKDIEQTSPIVPKSVYQLRNNRLFERFETNTERFKKTFIPMSSNLS